MSPAYAELHCLSNFTFLRGASHPHELIEQADALGLTHQPQSAATARQAVLRRERLRIREKPQRTGSGRCLIHRMCPGGRDAWRGRERRRHGG